MKEKEKKRKEKDNMLGAKCYHLNEGQKERKEK